MMNGFCGVNCTECLDYSSGKCAGCRASIQPEDPCFFVRCNTEKGNLHCGHCTSFPCADIADFSKESQSHERAYDWLLQARK